MRWGRLRRWAFPAPQDFNAAGVRARRPLALLGRLLAAAPPRAHRVKRVRITLQPAPRLLLRASRVGLMSPSGRTVPRAPRCRAMHSCALQGMHAGAALRRQCPAPRAPGQRPARGRALPVQTAPTTPPLRPRLPLRASRARSKSHPARTAPLVRRPLLSVRRVRWGTRARAAAPCQRSARRTPMHWVATPSAPLVPRGRAQMRLAQ